MTFLLSGRFAGSIRRFLLCLGLGATLVLGSTSSASAGTWSFNDPTQDVVMGGGEDPATAPERAVGDVKRLAVSHMRSKVVVRLNMREGLSGSNWTIFEYVRTPTATYVLYLRREDGEGHISLHRLSAGAGSSVRVRCSGVDVTYAPETVQTSIPTRCLGAPWVIKVASMIDTWDDDDFFYTDDALRGGLSDMPAYSAKVPRG